MGWETPHQFTSKSEIVSPRLQRPRFPFETHHYHEGPAHDRLMPAQGERVCVRVRVRVRVCECE